MVDDVNADVKFTADSSDLERASNAIIRKFDALHDVITKLDSASESTFNNLSRGLQKSLTAAQKAGNIEKQVVALNKMTREYERLLKVISRFGSLSAPTDMRQNYAQGVMGAQTQYRLNQIRNTPEGNNARLIQAELGEFARAIKSTTAMVNVAKSDLERDFRRASSVGYQNARAGRDRMSDFNTVLNYGDDDYLRLQRQQAIRTKSRIKTDLADQELQHAKEQQHRRRVEEIKSQARDTELRAAQERNKAAFRELTIAKSNTIGRDVAREQRRADPRYQRALDHRDREQENRLITRAERGSSAAYWDERLTTIGHDNGAGLLAVQSRIMVGYQALSMAFNTARGLSSFVVQLDKEFRQFQAITNTTEGEMIRMKKSLIGVSEATKFTALEVAEAATILGQAGLSAMNVRESIEAITLLATASGSDLNAAVETVTSTLSIFNLQADQATQIANTFTAALNGSKLSMDKITYGLQYAGNTAAQFGITYQELTAALGAMANSGIKSGSTLGTGMRQLLVELTTPSKKFKAQLDEVGLSVSDVDIRTQGLIPVLEKLRVAGFGVTEAYKSFEIRSAAAYTALSNNLDLSNKLEQSFLNSTAAIKANETQMQSLTNTWNKFQSVIGTLAYSAFEPLIKTLQQAVDLAANLMSSLNGLGPMLKVVSAAAAGVGTLIAAQTTIAVGKGIFGGLPIFAEYGSAMKTMSVNADGATKSFSRMGMVMSAIGSTLKANWVGVLIGAGVAAVTLFNAFNDGLTDTEKKLQTLEALQGRSKQQLETLEQEASALDQTISNLRSRQASLDADPIHRKLRIDETIAQFSKLNGNINSSTASVEDLIDALKTLKDINFSDKIAELQLIALQSDLAATQTRLVLGERGVNNYNVWGKTSPLQGLVDPAREYNTDRGNTTPRLTSDPFGRAATVVGYDANFRDIARTAAIYAESQAQALGLPSIQPGQISNVVEAIVNPGGAHNQQNLDLDFATIGRLAARVQEEQINLSQLIETGQSNTPAAKARLKELEEIFEFLKAVVKQAEPVNQLVAQVRAFESTRDAALDDRAIVVRDEALRKQIPQALESEALALRDQVPNFKDIFTEAGLDYGEIAYEDLKKAVEEVEKARHDWIEQLVAAGGDRGVLTSVFDKSLTGQATMEALRAGNEALDEQAEVLGKREERLAKENLNAAKKRLTDAKTQLSKAKTLDEIHKARREVDEAYKNLARATAQSHAVDLDNLDSTAKQEMARKAYLDEAEDQRRDRQADLKDAEDKRQSAEIANYDLLISSNKLAIDELKAEMDLAIQDLKGAETADMRQQIMQRVAELRARIVDLFDVQTGLLDSQHAVGNPDGSSFYSRMFGSESGGKFDIRNKEGYVGRVQFGQKRWSEVRKMIGADGVSLDQLQQDPAMQIRAEQAHFQDIQNFIARNRLMETYGGRVINGTVMDMGAMMGMAHLGGQGGMHAYLTSGGARNQNRKDSNNTHLSDYAAKFSGTNTDLSFYDQPSQRAYLENRVWDEKNVAAINKANEEGRDEEAKRAAKVTARRTVAASKAELDAINAAMKASSDPARVKALIDQATTVADRLVDQQLAQYDVENPNNTDGRSEAVKQFSIEREQNIAKWLEEYTRAADDASLQPLQDAKARLEEAQRPENRGRYSETDLQRLQAEVNQQETLQLTKDLGVAKEALAASQTRLADATQRYGDNSAEAVVWIEAVAEAERKVAELQRQLGIRGEMAAAPTRAPAQLAAAGYAANSGFIDPQTGQLKTELIQLEEAWGNVYSGMDSGLQTFFMSWRDGFDNIGDGFKSLGLSMIDMLMQMTARALAFQTVMALAGLAGESSVMGKALHAIAGVKGAAVGEYVSTGIPGRDSTLRKVEPGEMILRRSAVSAIGKDRLIEMNNLGSRKISAAERNAMGAPESGGVVNVWVVSPDQQQNMTEQDIIVTVANNIENRGSLKQLIKSVQMGNI